MIWQYISRGQQGNPFRQEGVVRRLSALTLGMSVFLGGVAFGEEVVFQNGREGWVCSLAGEVQNKVPLPEKSRIAGLRSDRLLVSVAGKGRALLDVSDF